MTTFTFDIADSFVVRSRGVDVTVDTTKLAPLAADVFGYGLIQKLGDSASGAMRAAVEAAGADFDKMSRDERRAWADANTKAIQTMTETMIGKALDAMYAGEWSTRVAGDGASEETRVGRALMRNIVKTKLGATSPKWKAFIGLTDAEQNAKLDAMVAANADKMAKPIADEMKRREAARKAKEAMAADMDIAL